MNPPQSLPFAPEPTEQLRSRFPKAISTTYSTHDLLDMAKTPCFKRENVFDFEDGVRAIVTKEMRTNKLLYLHFSFSVKLLIKEVDWAEQTLLKRIEELSGTDDYRVPEVYNLMDNLHFFFRA